MNLTHLKCVVEVARMGSISAAAQKLYMGQPNLSKMIKDLEKSMGITVFRRTAKGVEPTEKGAEMLKEAQKLLLHAEEFQSMFSAEKESKSVCIAVHGAAYCSVAFARLSASFSKEAEIDLSFYETGRDTAIGLVTEGKASTAVIRLSDSLEKDISARLSGSGLEAELLAEFTPNVLASKSGRLAQYREIEPSFLSDHIEVSCEKAGAVDFVKSAALNGGTWEDGSTAGKIEADSRIACYELLSSVKDAYMWISPNDCPKHYGLAAVPCTGLEACKDFLIYRQGKRFSTLEAELVKAIKAELKARSSGN